jgi:hypothetical protein
MKHLKTISLLVLMLTTGLTYGQFSWGPTGSLSFTNVAMKGNYKPENPYKTKIGYAFGIYGEYGVTQNLAFQLAFSSSNKGTKWEADGITYKLVLSYIELQPSAIYKFNVGKTLLFVQPGVYIAPLGTGRMKASEAVLGSEGDSKSETINMGNDKERDMMKATDFGLLLAGGIEAKGFGRFGLKYELGLSNLALVTENSSSIKNRALSIFYSVPFEFGKKKK